MRWLLKRSPVKSKQSAFLKIINSLNERNEQIQLKIMEIGVAGGATTRYLLETFDNMVIYACDPFMPYPDKPNRDHDEVYQQFIKNFKNYIDQNRLLFSRKKDSII